MIRNIGRLLATVLLLIAVLSLLPVHGETEIYESVVRLHVLANSDSEEDQARKLAVRDAILSEASSLFVGCTSREEAVAAIEANRETITEIAERTLREAGCDDPVTLILSEEDYPTRTYESMAFPAGRYLSLRVVIGSGEGQNWWCVLFPPLCLSAAVSGEPKTSEDAFISVGLTGEQYKIITETDSPTYRVRFKTLEILKQWLD